MHTHYFAYVCGKMLVVCMLLCGALPAAAELAGSPSVPPGGAVASAQRDATRVGEEILVAGGNAFDAAVAITAALAVVEPYASGLGGGGFWLLHHAKDGRQTMLDGRESAPSAASATMYLDKHGAIVKGASINGAKAAAIPGVPAALDYLAERYGRLPLKTLLEPAIRLAERGFLVTERYQKLAGFRLPVMQSYAATGALFLNNNEIPPLGHRIVQADLAKLLKRIGDHGADYFYHGVFAEHMALEVSRHGGIWEARDLANYRVFERRPIVARYHDLTVVSAPPPSSGGIALAQMLGILAHFDLSDPITRKHLAVEAMRFAYRDRAAYLGDPDAVHVPTHKLLQADYLSGLATAIDLERATPSHALPDLPFEAQSENRHTTHFSVIDAEGNRVSATLSINLPFGSGFVVPGTGVVLNNEMDDFSIKPRTPNSYGLVGNHSNAIAPNKRPLSSMSPTFIETQDRIGIVGAPGGSRIITMVLLAVLDFADGNLPRSWVSLPRYHHQYLPDELQFEKGGLSMFERRQLEKRGHVLVEKNRRYGNMQAILWDKKTNLLFVASDPRGEGEAVVVDSD